MALFVKLETTWLDSRKIILAPMALRGLHATALCLAKRTEDDGWFLRALLLREGADDELIGQAITVGLLEADGDLIRPGGWLDRNPSQAALAARRLEKVLGGIKGNHVKHKHKPSFEDCEPCQAKVALVLAGSETDAIASGTGTDAAVSPESDSESDPAVRAGANRDPLARPRLRPVEPVPAIAPDPARLESIRTRRGAEAQ